MGGIKSKSRRPDLQPDPLYNSILISKMINKVMSRGKKSLAIKIVYGALEIAKGQIKKEPVELLEKAIQNAGPLLEVRPTRVGGATYQVPREVSAERKVTLAMRWIIEAARGRKGKPMKEKLAQELVLAVKNEGEAVKKKINVHRMAEANKAFAHFAR